MPHRRLFALTLAAATLTALAASTSATAQVAAPTKLPAELELVKPLGFRTGPSLSATPVLANLNYLQPPTRVTVVAVQGTFGAAGTFCQVEYRGKRGFVRCDDANAFRATTSTAPAAPAASGGAKGKPAVVTRTATGMRCAPDVEYTNYKQYTGSWADDRVHPGYMTFGRTACHLTAWTTALGYYGQGFTPLTLRDKLDAMNGWRDVKTHPSARALETLTGGGKYVRKSGTAAGNKHNPEMVAFVRKHFCDDQRGEPMLGSVDYENDDDQRGDHWVTIVGFQDGEPLVLDPGSADAPHARISGTQLPANGRVRTGVMLSDIKGTKTGRYFLTGLELVE